MVQVPAAPVDVRERVIEAIQHRVAHELDAEVFQRDVAYVEQRSAALGRLATRYFAGEVRGLERLPPEGPFLVVSNHSGGWAMPDVWVFGTEFVTHFGASRELYALVFDSALAVPGFGRMLRKLGAVPASMDNAERALDLGAGVLVYPGGDWEAYRPWADRHRIDLHGRTGFVRLALRHGVPVFPAVSHGSHDSVIVLSRGEHMAHVVGLDRLRASVCPVVVGGPLGVTVFAPYVPLPTKIIVEVLEPVDWSVHGSGAADDPDVVASCYQEITGRMQQALDRLVSEVPHPLLARLRAVAGWRPGS